MKKYILTIAALMITAALYAGSVDHFTIKNLPASFTAGSSQSIYVAAVNASGNLASDYTGQVTLTASTGDVYVPDTYSNTITVTNGIWNGSVQMRGAGAAVTLTAVDNADYSITGTAVAGITPGAYSKLIILTEGLSLAPGTSKGYTGESSTLILDAPFAVTAYACDSYYNPVTPATGSTNIGLSCGISLVSSPDAVDLVSLASEKIIFSVTASNTIGTNTYIMIRDIANSINYSISSINFISDTTFYLWADAPAQAAAGQAFAANLTISHDTPKTGAAIQTGDGSTDPVSIKALDADGNFIPVTSTALTIAPQSKNLSGGTGTFNVAYNKRQMIKVVPYDGNMSRTITNKDKVSSYSGEIQIYAAEPSTFTVSVAKNKVNKGESSNAAFYVYDAYGNPVSGTVVDCAISGKGYFASSGTVTAHVTTDYYGAASAAFISQDYTSSDVYVSVNGVPGSVTYTVEVADITDKSLIKNFPNPFMPGKESTTITYYLDSDSSVEFNLYSVTGSKIWTKKIDKGMSPGGKAGYNQVSWDGVTDRGMLLPSGLFILKVKVDGTAGKYTLTRKIAVKK
jgi:hypothetical protein